MKENVAVIGAGHWGKNLVRVFSELGVLALVFDTNEDVLARLNVSVPTSIDLDDIDGNADITAVAIATPSASHYELAKKMLESGKDVYVEKPLCLSVDQGSELIDIARRNGRVLMVGHLLHYHPGVTAMKELLKEGELGDVRFIHAQRMNFGRFRRDENVLWSFAPHDISLALSITGELPNQVMSLGSRVIAPSMIDVTSSTLTFPSGVHMHMLVGWISPAKMQRFLLVGSKKMAVFDGLAGGSLQVFEYIEGDDGYPDALHTTVKNIPFEPSEPLRNECMHFLQCIAGRSCPLTDGEEGLRVLRVLDACQRSMEQEHAITLDAS